MPDESGGFIDWVTPPDSLEAVTDEAGGEGLDAAWAEAEAALPGGWRIDRVRRQVGADGWTAWAERYPPDYTVPVALNSAMSDGPTPAAALRALAARLSQPDATEEAGR